MKQVHKGETQSRYKMDVEGGCCFVVQSEVKTCLSIVHFVVGLHTPCVPIYNILYYAEMAQHMLILYAKLQAYSERHRVANYLMFIRNVCNLKTPAGVGTCFCVPALRVISYVPSIT
jgi:hypothetical protein